MCPGFWVHIICGAQVQFFHLFTCYSLPNKAYKNASYTGSNPTEANAVQGDVLSEEAVKAFAGHTQGTQTVYDSKNSCKCHCRTEDFGIAFKDAAT